MSKGIVEDVVSTMELKQGAVRAVRFNVDGQYCMTCGSDKMLKLWNPRSGVALKSYAGHGYEVLDCKASCDNANLCSCGMDKVVIFWDVASGNVLRKYRGHAGTVNCVSFNEESTVILSGSIDGNINVWDCRSRKMDPVQVLDDAKDSVTSIQVSDHEIITGSADCKVRKYDIRNGEMISDFVGKPVTCVNFTKDGQCLLITSLDNTLRLLDKGTGELLNEYTGHKNSEYKIDSCLTNEDTHIITGSEDGHVFIWDLVEAKIVKKLQHPSKRTVHSLSYHPTEALLLTASENKVYLWKPKDS